MTTTSPTTESISELVTTGEYLAGARHARGMSIEDVAHTTRIPRGHLRALEAGDYGCFDGVAYAKSFLRLYGNFLEVDVAEALEVLEQRRELPGTANHYPFLEVPDKVRLSSKQIAPRSRSLPLVLVLGAIALVVLLPFAFLVAKRHWAPDRVEETAPATTSASLPAPGAETRSDYESEAAASDIEGIVKLPDGQLDRIRNQQPPEVRRAVIVKDEQSNEDNAGAAGDQDAPPIGDTTTGLPEGN